MRARRPDMVLLDVHMPVLSGVQVLKAMKADSTLRHIPVYMLTTLRAERDVRLAQAMGAAGYLAKPFDPQLLFERIELAFADAS